MPSDNVQKIENNSVVIDSSLTENGKILDKNVSSPTSSSNKTTLKIKIDNDWYDLTQWQHIHPGGAQILSHLNNEDATDAFYSLHSKEAIARLKRLPKTSAPMKDEPQTPSMLINFRQFRSQLEAEGFFQRNPYWDCAYLGVFLVLFVSGSMLSYSHPWLATLLLGLAMEQAGWLAHDYVHGRGTASYWLGRALGGFVNGFSSKWWSNKHNTHHCYPNTVGIDLDIQNDPVFHIWTPSADKDVSFRRFQHIYFFPVVSFLYLSWRLQSFHYVRQSGDLLESFIMSMGYLYLLCLPWAVAIGAILVGGFFVGVIVTVTHQSEDLLSSDREYNFVRDQFLSTRNASTNNPFLNWLWGGMQFQLEHHLFPTMPKYYYSTVSKRLRQYAKENNIEYRVDGAWEILIRNLETMQKFAVSQPAVVTDTATVTRSN